MIIDCISDLHGHYPKTEGGDLLIIAGDLTASDKPYQYFVFKEWLRKQDYRKKIFITGNHDGCIERGGFYFGSDWMGGDYLQDSGIEFEGLKIWGSPWTSKFEGINPNCCAFTGNHDKEISEKFSLIPSDTDILITHSPPLGILDEVEDLFSGKIENVGSASLSKELERVRPLYHIFGHIHEGYGKTQVGFDTTAINASHVNRFYNPVNPPIRIIL